MLHRARLVVLPMLVEVHTPRAWAILVHVHKGWKWSCSKVFFAWPMVGVVLELCLAACMELVGAVLVKSK